MYKFSKKSLKLLNNPNLDIRLKNLMLECIKYYDFTILETLRTKERQKELFDNGKSKTMSSKHLIGKAIDIAPYPIDWNNTDRFIELSKIIKEQANKLNINIVWGGDWKSFVDMPHYEIE